MRVWLRQTQPLDYIMYTARRLEYDYVHRNRNSRRNSHMHRQCNCIFLGEYGVQNVCIKSLRDRLSLPRGSESHLICYSAPPYQRPRYAQRTLISVVEASSAESLRYSRQIRHPASTPPPAAAPQNPKKTNHRRRHRHHQKS